MSSAGPVTTSISDNSTSPRKPRVAPRDATAGASRPCQRSWAGTSTSLTAASQAAAPAVPPPPRVRMPWASIRSRACSGCSTSVGPLAKCSTTTSSPGWACTRCALPSARRRPTRTDALTRPRRPMGGCRAGPVGPPRVPAAATISPGITKVIGAARLAGVLVVAMFGAPRVGSCRGRSLAAVLAGQARNAPCTSPISSPGSTASPKAPAPRAAKASAARGAAPKVPW